MPARIIGWLSVWWAVLCGCSSAGLAGERAAQAIAVGSRKQLFIDERFIASSRGVQLTMNAPLKMNQPVLASYLAWQGEPGAAAGSYGSVIKENGKIRIWGQGLLGTKW